jgi:hypothetical protein
MHRSSDRLLTVLFVWTLLGAGAFRAAAAGARADGERWVYCHANLQVDRAADDVIAPIERTSRDGYTAVMLADYKFQVLDRVPDFSFRNVERVKAAAARARIKLIPAGFSIGYSNGHLAHDPNLAEGLPVIDQPFVVREQTETIARKGSVAGFDDADDLSNFQTSDAAARNVAGRPGRPTAGCWNGTWRR